MPGVLPISLECEPDDRSAAGAKRKRGREADPPRHAVVIPGHELAESTPNRFGCFPAGISEAEDERRECDDGQSHQGMEPRERHERPSRELRPEEEHDCEGCDDLKNLSHLASP